MGRSHGAGWLILRIRAGPSPVGGSPATELLILSQTARPANPRGASRRMASNLNGGPGRARAQARSFVLVSLDQLVGAEQEGTGAGVPGRACDLTLQEVASSISMRASLRMRSTIERTPFDRWGVRCSDRPRPRNKPRASVVSTSDAGLPE